MTAVVFTVLTALGASSAPAGEIDFPTPSDDRWHYPFKFTPGSRGIAACFSSVGNLTFPSFNDRDGILLVAWNTSERIEPGRCPADYAIEAVTVELTHTPDAYWLPDLTTDEWFTFDANNDGAVNRDAAPRGTPQDRDGESNDLDPGRPLELFGVAFGSNTTYATWHETTPYHGANDTENRPRDPFPFVPQIGTDAKLHVEDSVKGTHNATLPNPVFQFTPQPWAMGVPQNYTPGLQPIPFVVEFPIDLTLHHGAVLKYLQEQLAGGRVLFAITSMQETVIFGGGVGEYATFYTKESVGLHPLARSPRLVIRLGRSRPSGDTNSDCRVNLIDAAAWGQCMFGPDNRPNPQPPMTDEACLAVFDFDEDGDVDLHDLGSFLERFVG